MDIIAARYVKVLRFIEASDGKYDFETLCKAFPREDLIYLNKEYITPSFNVMTLQPKGRNYLAALDFAKSSAYATKKDNKKATTIAIAALVISVVLGIAQLLISLLQ